MSVAARMSKRRSNPASSRVEPSSIGPLCVPSTTDELSKPGLVIEPAAQSPIPLAGFFAAGEIGTIGEESFVHGHTACLALFSDRQSGAQERLVISEDRRHVGGANATLEPVH